MAQDEQSVPNSPESKRKASNLLPRFFRTVANEKFLGATMDQLINPGVVEKLDGFVGRKDAKAWQSTDNYISDVTADRENYQLEPMAVVKDNLGNVNFNADYLDYVNSLSIRGANTNDHSRISSQEYYAWNPHINWDKFVNFREYYWLPNGPDPINIVGQTRDIQSTYNVISQDNGDNLAYVFNSQNKTSNPTLTLYKGQTYTFEINTPGMPFTIRKTNELGDNLYDTGVTGQKTDIGTLTFKIPLNAPEKLYYVNDVDVEGSGLIIIKEPQDSSYINVEEEIVGKKNYTMPNGYKLSNGMKLTFSGITDPEKYGEDEWLVEGVGESIKLIREKDLDIPASFLFDRNVQFDDNPFDKLPFDDATSYAETKDYIVVNKSATDRNQWARYNRWTHIDVITTTAKINNVQVDVNQNNRAARPILEFDAGLKLFNFGTQAKADVDLVDTVTKDVFSDIEGSIGYYVDNIQLVNGMRVLFTADPDIRVNGKIYQVNLITHNGKKQLSLVETSDSEPALNENVLVKQGDKYKGKMFYYNGSVWQQGQDKTKVNQQPLFDIYDSDGQSVSSYDASTFKGTKVFSYKVGTGANDTELGFPLSYRTVQNSGDITFDFNLLTDTFQYQDDVDLLTQSTDTGLLRIYNNRTDFTSVTGWIKANTHSFQTVNRQYDTTKLVNNFPIDVYSRSGDLNDLEVSVYVDNIKQTAGYEIDRINGIAFVRFDKPLALGQKLVVKTNSSTTKNENGYYEFPVNFESNPKNENIVSFTLGQVQDHAQSITENIKGFQGSFPGNSNLRDLGQQSTFGTKFVQHSGPINLAVLHTASSDFDAVGAIRYARLEYAKFKRSFLETANNIGFDAETFNHVNKVLQTISQSKNSNNSFYNSDMVPYKGEKLLEYTVLDDDLKVFALTSTFSIDKISSQAVLVYVNEVQKIVGIDYNFNDNGFIEFVEKLTVGDVVKIYEYESTLGNYIPATPTKLGLYPKYLPEVVIDDTYVYNEPEGNGPFKIYGVAGKNQNGAGKLGWFYPLYTTEADANAADPNGKSHQHTFEGLHRVFYMPNTGAVHAGPDSITYDQFPVGAAVIRGHDGSVVRCFGDFRDRLLLDLETRIYNNIKIDYDKNLFNIEEFIPTANNDTGFNRNDVDKIVITDFNDWLDQIGNADYTLNDFFDRENGFTFNYSKMSDPDGNPLPGFWRAIYKNYYRTDRPHTHPWEIQGFTMKPTWWESQYGTAPYTSDNLILWEDIEKGLVWDGNKKVVKNNYKTKNLTKYIPVDREGKLLSPNNTGYSRGLVSSAIDDGFVFGDQAPTETAWRRSSEYPFALLVAWLINQPAKVFGLGFDRSRIIRNDAGQIIYKDTGKRISLSDLKFPSSVIDETEVLASGLVNYMQDYTSIGGIAGYTRYKDYLTNITNQLGMKVGGYTQKSKFRLILDSRTPTNEGNIFLPDENYDILFRKSIPTATASYSGVIVQKVPDGYTVKGYDRNSPSFKYLAPIHKKSDSIVNVGGISEEFLDWANDKFYEKGQYVRNNTIFYVVKEAHTSTDVFDTDKFQRVPELPISGGAQIKLPKLYESVAVDVPYGSKFSTIQEVADFLLGYGKYLESIGFTFDAFDKDIEEVQNWLLSTKEFMYWTQQNWGPGAVITLSPSAQNLQFNKPYHVVDDIFNNFYDYSLLKADGKKLSQEFGNTIRDKSNEFGLSLRNTADGIYHIKLPTVQKEHLVLIDNRSVFGDILYDLPSGYRQQRIRVLGYRTDEWDGGFNIPGFIYDDATVTEWEAWKDYAIGDLVKYKQFYYTASNKITGASEFQDNEWLRLSSQPEKQLLANFDYKVNQFTDFFDLDSDNFDIEQQRLAQHTIGFQKRQYLENIIPDSVSQFKFFQGVIQDKGSKNSLIKLFDKLGNTNDTLEFYEEWAIKNGQYGSTKSFEEWEIKVNENSVRLEPQTIELVNEKTASDTSLIYKLDRQDIYVKPQNYDHKPFPTKYVDKSYTPTAGYVNSADVKHTILNLDDILDIGIKDINIGEYVWVGQIKNDWDVLKYIDSNVRVSEVKTDGTDKILVCSLAPDVGVGDIVGLRNFPNAQNDKFYKVKDVTLNELNLGEVEIADATDLAVYGTKFVSARKTNTAEGNEFIQNTDILPGEIIWIDNDDNNKWTVLKNNPLYEQRPFIYNTNKSVDSTEIDFGHNLSVTSNNNTVLVTSPSAEAGSLYVFSRGNEENQLGLTQTITEVGDFYDAGGGFAQQAAVSADGKYIVIGAPNSSNVKSRFKGQHSFDRAYAQNDVVEFTNQLWQALVPIPRRDTVTFNTFKTNAQIIEDQFDSETNLYPAIPFIVRGNFKFPNETTDHILIKAPTDQYQGSAQGDRLDLVWNQYTTNYINGILPFDGDSVISKNFIDGEHSIFAKVDVILYIDDTKNIPQVGETVQTNLGSGVVAHILNNTDNQTLLYLKDVNGSFPATTETESNFDLYLGTVFVGVYERLLSEPYTGFDGWWMITLPSDTSTTVLYEYKPQLVIKDVIPSAGAVSTTVYHNILDTFQNQRDADLTKVSWIETLSHTNQQTLVDNVDSRWIIRPSAQYGASLSVGDDFRLWFNTLYDANGVRQDPSAIGLPLSVLNDNVHTVDDIWEGWLEITLDNFDLQDNAIVPEIGDIIQDDTTNATAEVAYLQVSFSSVKLFVKNVTGVFSLGRQANDNTRISFQDTASTSRDIGPLLNRHFSNSVSGKLLVVSNDAPISIRQTRNLEGKEYWFYSTTTRQGIIRDIDRPGRRNKNWKQVYNIPAIQSADSSNNDHEGVIAIYEKGAGLIYNIVNYFTVPDSADMRFLGSKVAIRHITDDEYIVYALAKGDGSEDNQGRIYTFRKSSTKDWWLGRDFDYRGDYRNDVDYFENEIVRFSGNTYYKAKTNMIPGQFNSDNWEELTSKTDLHGFIPNDTGINFGDSVLEQNDLIEFGYDFDISLNGEVLVAKARYNATDDSSVATTKAVVYRLVNGNYEYSQILESENLNESFADSVSVSSDGQKIAIGAPTNDHVANDAGIVYIYQNDNGTFVKIQELRSRVKRSNTRFGSNVDFDGEVLAVTSKGGDIVSETTFDNESTVFDTRLTKYLNVDNDSGVVSIYETQGDTLIFGQDFTFSADTLEFGDIINVTGNHVYIGLPKQEVTIPGASYDRGLVVEYRKPTNSKLWKQHRSPVDPVDVSKIKTMFLYDVRTNRLVTYLDYIDVQQGKIAGPAEQEIYFKTPYDPARYNNVSNDRATKDELDPTTDTIVGRIWWDIDSAKFENNNQGTIVESTNKFNKIFPGTEVVVCEWIETTLLPNQWDAQADTEEGLAKGISGRSLYGNDAYSTKRVFDPVSQGFTTKYFYWVKDKKTIPQFSFRKISAFDVKEFIQDPASQAHKFVSLLANNRLALYNVGTLFEDENIALNVTYYKDTPSGINVHNEYNIVSDGLSTSKPSEDIEKKWFHSLVGYDEQDRPVPDPNLPDKQKYGVLFNPRQSWFINRQEAGKQFFERLNTILKQNIVVDEFDISGLNDKDPLPTKASGRFDTSVDSYAELRFVGTSNKTQAKISLNIINGVITEAFLEEPGGGYDTIPTYEIVDTTGSGAELEFTLNSETGAIDSVNIINGGSSYSSNTSVIVRKFSALVKNDETVRSKWSIFSWDGNNWQRVVTQSFDTTLYWQYIDWYAPGYSNFTSIDYTVKQSYEINLLQDQIGDVVKIENVGTGGWLLLEKINNISTEDYTANYKTIGRQNGTIEFKRNIYDISEESVGFDGSAFDKLFYDTYPVQEYRNILNIIKNNILIDDLEAEYNKLFFNSLRYVFSEQLTVDWAFKTSFVKAKHKFGELRQDITFNNDNLPSYENYVEEMKPFKTKIREYISSYSKTDSSNSMVTDFDLPAYYSNASGKIIPQQAVVKDNELQFGENIVTTYPSKNWFDNVGFEIAEVAVSNGGKGYTSAPTITLEGGGGTGAVLKAYIGAGKITNVEVVNPGSGYVGQPTVTINGSLADGGEHARLSVILGNGKVRSSHIRVKFDRTTSSYLIQTLDETETFTSSSNQQIFDLKWPMDLRNTTFTITVDGIEALSSEFTYSNVIDTSKGYTRYKGKISFVKPVKLNQIVKVVYQKSADLLQAQDRINLYYQPTTGMLGKDLGQLLDGVDYGGVQVDSIDFGGASGWDSDEWTETAWDTFDTSYQDEVFSLDGSTSVFNLSEPLANGVVYNIYKNGVRIDDPNFGNDDSTTILNENALMRSLVGDGVTRQVVFNEEEVTTSNNDIIIIRKSTSDGSFVPDPNAYDTILRGGDLAFSTATGLNAEDITIDGDGFVTPTTSKGPEELVPGQILDAVDIQVYHLPGSGGSQVSSNSYVGDGSTKNFEFGLLPQSADALLVKIDGVIKQTTDYTVDYKNKIVKLNTAPALGHSVNIVSLTGNGEKIMDMDVFYGDGSTNSFLTDVNWADDLSFYATVNGEVVDTVIETSDSSYDTANKVVLAFGVAPASNSVINWTIYKGESRTFSQIEIDEFTGDGSTNVYTLSQTPFSSQPSQHNILVQVDNKILNAGYNEEFTVDANTREYELRQWQLSPGTFGTADILVFLNGRELSNVSEYNVRPANSSIVLFPGVGSTGDKLEVYNRTNGEYAFGQIVIGEDSTEAWQDSPDKIYLDETPADGAKIKVFHFSKHDVQDFERIKFDVVERVTLTVGTDDYAESKRLRAGLIKLRREAIDAEYVWVTINGLLKTPSVDYILTDDKKFIRLGFTLNEDDVIELIQFSSDGAVSNKFGYRQFKDMLNRTHYKRLGDANTYRLAKDLKVFDTEIELENGDALPEPNKESNIPGVIFVNGERIEYFAKDENKLTQLRRGTLGTGVAYIHYARSKVFDQGVKQSIPYKDENITEVYDGDDSTHQFTLSWTPDSVNEMDVFVGGKRLRKNAISIFDATKDQDSPEADISSPAEFSISGNLLVLERIPGANERVQVVRKTGKRWTPDGVSLADADSLIARFLKAEKVELPK